MIGRKNSAAASISPSVDLLDEASHTVRLWLGCDEDGSRKGNMLKPAVVTTPAVLEKLAPKVAGKLAFWGPKMGANAPRKPVLPRALDGNTLQPGPWRTIVGPHASHADRTAWSISPAETSTPAWVIRNAAVRAV